MKKKVALIIFILNYTLFVNAQIPLTEINFSDITTEYSTVFQKNSPAKTKYSNLKSEIAKLYHDYNSVVKLEDTETHRIIIKGKLSLPKDTVTSKISMTINNSYLQYTLIIDCREDKYRFKFEDLMVSVKSTTKIPYLNPRIDEHEETIQKYCEYQTEEFENAIRQYQQELDSLNSIPDKSLKQKRDDCKSTIEIWQYKLLEDNKNKTKRKEAIVSGLLYIINELAKAIEKDEDDF